MKAGRCAQTAAKSFVFLGTIEQAGKMGLPVAGSRRIDTRHRPVTEGDILSVVGRLARVLGFNRGGGRPGCVRICFVHRFAAITVLLIYL